MRSASCGFCHIRCCSSRQSSMLTSRRPFVYADTCIGTTQLDPNMGKFSEVLYANRPMSTGSSAVCTAKEDCICWAISGAGRARRTPPEVPWQAGGRQSACAVCWGACPRPGSVPIRALSSPQLQPWRLSRCWQLCPAHCVAFRHASAHCAQVETCVQLCGQRGGCSPRGTFMRAMAFTRRRSDTYTGGSMVSCSIPRRSASTSSTTSGTVTSCAARSLHEPRPAPAADHNVNQQHQCLFVSGVLLSGIIRIFSSTTNLVAQASSCHAFSHSEQLSEEQVTARFVFVGVM